MRWFNGVPSPVKHPELVNMVIFRENTEDVYTGIEFESGTEDVKKVLTFLKDNFPQMYRKIRFPDTVAIGIKPISREGTERLVRAAIQYAIANRRKSVTLVHKGNIMKFTAGAFRNWGYALAEREFPEQTYTWTQWETTRSAEGEAAANAEQKAALESGKDPDQGRHCRHHLAAGAHASYRLRCHRHSQPQRRLPLRRPCGAGGRHRHRAGRQYQLHDGPRRLRGDTRHRAQVRQPRRVNPGSVILSGEMMLRYLGWTEAADLMIKGMDGAIGNKTVTYDFARLMEGAREVKCSEFGDAVIAHM